jgi:hypothetical protein
MADLYNPKNPMRRRTTVAGSPDEAEDVAAALEQMAAMPKGARERAQHGNWPSAGGYHVMLDGSLMSDEQMQKPWLGEPRPGTVESMAATNRVMGNEPADLPAWMRMGRPHPRYDIYANIEDDRMPMATNPLEERVMLAEAVANAPWIQNDRPWVVDEYAPVPSDLRIVDREGNPLGRMKAGPAGHAAGNAMFGAGQGVGQGIGGFGNRRLLGALLESR